MNVKVTSHVLGAVILAAFIIGTVEAVLLNLRPPFPDTSDALVLTCASFGAVLLWTAVIGGPSAALLLRVGRLQTLNARVSSFARWGSSLAACGFAVAIHIANATQYVRLYLAIHVALTVATSISAVAGALALPWVRAESKGWSATAFAAACALLLGLSMVRVASAPESRALALEKTTHLNQTLLVLHAVSAPDRITHDTGSTPTAAAATASSLARGAHVIVFTIDAMRGDYFPSANDREQMRWMEAVASEGTTFTRAFAPSCWTVHSMAGTITGTQPARMRYDSVVVDQALNFFVVERKDGLFANPLAERAIPSLIRDRTPTLAGFLREAGYQTVTVPSWEIYHPRAGLTRDFEHVDDRPLRKVVEAGLSGKKDVELTEAAIALIDSTDPSRPLLLWLHYMHPHAPYISHGDVPASASDRERYVSELRFVDREVGEVLEHLRSRAMLENAIIVLHGDHGEEFGEHGGKYHASSVYQEQVHVPFVIRLPKRIGAPRGRLVDAPVSLLDLTPTLLDLTLTGPLPRLDGRSLTPALLGRDIPTYPVVMDCVRMGRHKRAVVAWPFKLIVDDRLSTIQLYDLASDPRERLPLSDDDRVSAMLTLLPPIHSAGTSGE
jgi:arylsulfatase A-like enzyme